MQCDGDNRAEWLREEYFSAEYKQNKRSYSADAGGGQAAGNGHNVYDKNTNLVSLRQQVGMVFQKPNPFPKSIFDNVAYGPRLQGIKNRSALQQIVESSLRAAALWDEVKDDVKKSALALSGGQQQRLCIATGVGDQAQCSADG